ncbi:MFS transporter [Litorimonas sp. RW-G-Af-16]|uniref:MFS transporter n=1 Tax=Litorimonas sp. RW-G-Af-16 TaxID=3241168 RepID=UPI00390C8E9E
MSLKIAGNLLTKRTFLPLFVLFQAGTVNDNVLKNALIALVTYAGMVLFSDDLPRNGLVAIAALLFTLPFLILCTIAGQIADKVDRGVILKWIKRAEVLIMVVAAIGLFLQNTYILALTLALMGAQSAFFSPTKNAVLPQWLKDDELITANGLMSGFQFFCILLAMVLGIQVVMTHFNKATMGFDPDIFWIGPRLIAVILLVLAFIGWFAAERVPTAPAPKPDLKIDWNPVTSIIGVLKTSFQHMPVFRPMLGIAWFYGFSNVMILVLPVFVADVLRYDETVLVMILVASTLSILIGSLLCLVLARGKEAMGLVLFGIIGVTLFTLDLYLNTEPSARTTLAGMEAFKADPQTPRFLLAIMGSSICAGLYVVPLQAMAQRRSPVEVRARLMSAGAVLLNAAVNIVTFGLIGLSLSDKIGLPPMKPATPFLAVVIISSIVSVYAIRRFLQMRRADAAKVPH